MTDLFDKIKSGELVVETFDEVIAERDRYKAALDEIAKDAMANGWCKQVARAALDSGAAK